ncbi:hypothetical protein FVE85_3739 [Porphyridium purpureum]|uniref:Uncharacterized protein n=1 Tax=Porphyridium purpureum TaxID=35688 RepID=A0A5J4YLE2_PORPP|nr:hypothetical protein FVE85_3739 [Porphyridium purpureum]|eukprot:POR1725..scf249_10
MARVDAVTGNSSHVTVAHGAAAVPSSSTGGGAVGPRGSRAVQAEVQSADGELRFAKEWEKEGNTACAYEYFRPHSEHGAGWVSGAAETGHTDPVIAYGRCHHSGLGVPQTSSLAKECHTRTAKLGSRDESTLLEKTEAEER